MTRRWTLVVALACAVGAPSPALASPLYSAFIRDDLGLAEQPSCTFCHLRTPDGFSTGTAFSDALEARGFSRNGGLTSLRAALERLDADRVDSDGDGAADIAELVAGANPVLPDGGVPPRGCAVSAPADLGSWWAETLALFGLAVALGRRWLARD